ncbi:hypothetical protein AG1IA_01338 [Rhizoctonia solani AG-1 IA]|uniref:Uncharacterized protein n=1 Tax=Thanatephorus cucumeris (strain AG1-IA) TaxID=983506 RepID=L8X341_THACA|nr:hypothetical protein AG1IA_01338 [Rhizoctonia solani AG-1 IA]
MSAASTIVSTPSPGGIGSNHPSNDLYWTSPDPRDSGVIGYEGAQPVFWRLVRPTFRAVSCSASIFKGVDQSSREEEVARLDLCESSRVGDNREHGGSHVSARSERLGVSVRNPFVRRGYHLSQINTLVSSRQFMILDPQDQRVFEWRQDELFNNMYRLHNADGTVIASFELYDMPQPSSIGPLYAVMRYWYKEDDNV